MGKEVKCDVCSEQPSKYKCPKCMIPYCSLACYKAHQTVLCEERQSLINTTAFAAAASSNISESDQAPVAAIEAEPTPEDCEDYISPETLAQLANNSNLRELLENPHLQNIIRDIDTAATPNDVIEKAMREPLFEEFAQSCLETVEPSNQ